VKQVIVVNDALGMPPGKLAAQVGHAAIAAFLEANDTQRRRWLEDGMTKIVLRCESDAALEEIAARAEREGLPVALIADAGHTVLEAGTRTCVGVGPADAQAIDRVTGSLKLLR
jgi:peptidyl-tRNA hydrolase